MNRIDPHDHPAIQLCDRIDDEIVARMLGIGSPGGAVEAFGVRKRNQGIEVFERQSLHHIAWFACVADAYKMATALNEVVVAKQRAINNHDPNNRPV